MLKKYLKWVSTNFVNIYETKTLDPKLNDRVKK